jgi:nicotinamidase-related amidase
VPTDPRIPHSLEELLAPGRTALLLIDMVNDFVHPEGKAAVRGGRPLDHIHSIIPAMQRLREAARAAGALVVHVQHTTLRNGGSDSPVWLEARRRSKYSAVDVCVEGTWGHHVIDELRPADDEQVVRKYRYGGFIGTSLELVLRSRGIETVVCTGSSTNVCVEATAREAFSHEFYVVLPRDACASWDRSLHEASLETAQARYATVVDSDAILAAWSRAGAREPLASRR